MGAEARMIVSRLRGAEAPLFYGAACFSGPAGIQESSRRSLFANCQRVKGDFPRVVGGMSATSEAEEFAEALGLRAAYGNFALLLVVHA
jgi:hypothetical protein